MCLEAKPERIAGTRLWGKVEEDTRLFDEVEELKSQLELSPNTMG
jgi:hypothetical protein